MNQSQCSHFRVRMHHAPFHPLTESSWHVLSIYGARENLRKMCDELTTQNERGKARQQAQTSTFENSVNVLLENMKQTVKTVLLAIQFGTAVTSQYSEIRNLQTGTAGSYPYLATNTDRRHFCAGSLITSDFILAAAHCQGCFKKGLIIGSGNLDDSSSGELRNVSKSFAHPDFDPTTGENDVMLLRLNEPVTNLEPVMYGGSPATASSLKIVGYGKVESAEILPVPNSEEVFPEQEDACLDLCEDLDFDKYFCTTPSSTDFIYQNSGGPILDENGVVVGTKALSGPCGGTRDIYIRVSVLEDWIQQLVCAVSIDPPASCGDTGGGLSTCSDSTDPFDDSSETVYCADLAEPSEQHSLCGDISVALHCPVTCGACGIVDAYTKDKCADIQDQSGTVSMSQMIGERDCAWLDWLLGLTYHIAFVCEDTEVALHCPKTCKTCDKLGPVEV